MSISLIEKANTFSEKKANFNGYLYDITIIYFETFS